MKAACAALIFSSLLAGESALPQGARKSLDKSYPGWKMAPGAPQIASWYSEYGFKFQANFIPADFDGDGRTDYAVAIIAGGRQLVVALLDRGATFERHKLTDDPPDPFTSLLLYAKGSKDFDFRKLKPFRYAHDSVGVMYFEKTPLTFQYRRNRFQGMLSPSDEE